METETEGKKDRERQIPRPPQSSWSSSRTARSNTSGPPSRVHSASTWPSEMMQLYTRIADEATWERRGDGGGRAGQCGFSAASVRQGAGYVGVEVEERHQTARQSAAFRLQVRPRERLRERGSGGAAAGRARAAAERLLASAAAAGVAA